MAKKPHKCQKAFTFTREKKNPLVNVEGFRSGKTPPQVSKSLHVYEGKIYIYIYIYQAMYTYITHSLTHIYKHIHTYAHTHIYKHNYKFTHIRTHAHIHTYT